MKRQKHPLQVIAEWFLLFHVDFTQAIRAEPDTVEGLVQAFDKSKVEAKANFKTIAFEKHPDRGGDLKEFQELTDVWNRLQKIVIRPKPRPRPMPFTSIHIQTFVSRSPAQGHPTTYVTLDDMVTDFGTR